MTRQETNQETKQETSYKLIDKQLWTKQQVQQIVDEVPEGKQKVYIEVQDGYYCIAEQKQKYLVKKFKKIC